MRKVLLLTLVVIATMVALSLLPDGLTIGRYEVLPAHALDDLLPAGAGEAGQEADSIIGLAEEHVDTCPEGKTCIVDFAADRRGMTPLYVALARRAALGRPVRIAVLGDSYIQGDILTEPLRALLQQAYGGCGVGLVPMSNSKSNQFRRSVKHEFGQWQEFLANQRSGYDAARYGTITASYFTAEGHTWTSLTGVTHSAHLDSCYSSTLIYYAPDGGASASATATINGSATLRHSLGGSAGYGAVSVDGHMGSVRWDIDNHGLTFIGASMDAAPGGVVLDNFAMESLTGYHLGNIPQDHLRGFDNVRHYDLVVLMFGQNIANVKASSASAYNSYVKHMTGVIDALKQGMPGTGFLIVSIGDRNVKRGGAWVTPDGIKLMIAAQQRVAMECGTAFFNLYDAMGGEGSVARLVEQGMANKDYTHINHRGGAQLAPLLADAIEWGYDCYERRHGGKGGTR